MNFGEKILCFEDKCLKVLHYRGTVNLKFVIDWDLEPERLRTTDLSKFRPEFREVQSTVCHATSRGREKRCCDCTRQSYLRADPCNVPVDKKNGLLI